MIRKVLLFLVFLKLCMGVSFAQTKQISGKVLDGETKEPLIGVSLKVKDLPISTQTNLDGEFSFNVSTNDPITLIINYVGYKNQQINVGSQTQLTISLEQDISALNEVVVIGYGTVSRKDLAGSVSSIRGSEIEKTPVTSIAEALTGRLPGVQVTTLDGAPGADIIIRVRGGGSITQDNSPLYIVDGFFVDDISNIATTDIESIHVLKDASSSAIYGSRGANGVLIITTKSPKAGKTSINYNAYSQGKKLPRNLDVLSPYEFALAQYELGRIRGTSSSEYTNFLKYYGAYDDIELYKYSKPTNWQDEMFGRTVNSQQHNLSISGGTDKTKLSFNTTYNDDEGLLNNSGQKRLYFNFKMGHEISKKLQLDLSARYSNTLVDGAGTAGSSSVRIGEGIQTRPIDGLAENMTFNPEDIIAGDDDFESFLRSMIKPTELITQDYRQRHNRDFNLNAALGWDVIKNLKFKSEFSVALKSSGNKRYWGPLTGESRNVGLNQPLAELSSGKTDSYRWVNTANYNVLNNETHNLTLLFGQELQFATGSSVFNRAKYFDENLSPEMLFANMALGTSERLETREVRGEDMASFFGRISYSLNNKYVAYFTLRADGTSKFAPNERWGYFPAGSLAWKIGEEDFIKNVSQISDLKLRVSYGEAGNNRIPNDSWRFLFGPSANRTYGAGDINQTYFNVINSSLPNPNLKWETTISRNIGLDFGLFKDRITASLDFYKNTTKDLIVDNEIPPHTGFTRQLINIGQTSNKGFEFGLNAELLSKKDYRLSASFNIGRNISKVDRLDGNDLRFLQSNWVGTDLRSQDDYLLMTGKTIGLMYGYVNDGFYTTDDFKEFISATNTYVLNDGVTNLGSFAGGVIGVRPGTMKLRDLDGDGKITTEDRKIIGNATPKHSGGFGLSATLKSFDVSTFFNWVYGNQIYNTGRIQFNMLYRTTFGNMLDRMNYDDRYKYINANGELVRELADLAELNKDAKVWSPFSSGSASPVFTSDAVEDGSFLRMTYFTVGYRLPKVVLSKIGISSIRVYGTVYNAFLWTNYTGYDPEVSTTRSSSYAALTPGVDFSAYPKSRTFTFGFNVNF
jgi:TonB-linked SusC/RagA family outer membrane protein